MISKRILLFSLLVLSARSKTFRYRNGVSDGETRFFEEGQMSVPAARNRCNELDRCVSFSFSSPTRFPGEDIKVLFYEHADWHVKPNTGEPTFVEDATWHTYINSTRELRLIENEVNQVLSQLQGPSNLRGRDSSLTDRTAWLLSALFEIVTPKPHRVVAAPIIAPYAIKLASDTKNTDDIRLMAMRLLVLLGDSIETGKILISHGSYQTMKTIILDRKEWDEVAENALDVIANICFYRSANFELNKLGAVEFLQGLVSEPGFPGLQAAMALAHLKNMQISLPKETIDELIFVLRSAIDGDVAHGIIWDLVPGPLSAIKYLVRHGDPEGLLDAGVMEELLRILEESENSEELVFTLEIMMTLSQTSDRARDMILLADHSIHDMRDRLASFQRAIDLAGELSSLASLLGSPRFEL